MGHENEEAKHPMILWPIVEKGVAPDVDRQR